MRRAASTEEGKISSEEDDVPVSGPGDYMLHHPVGVLIVPVLRVDGPENDGTARPGPDGGIQLSIGRAEQKMVMAQDGLEQAPVRWSTWAKIYGAEPGECGVIIGVDTDLMALPAPCGGPGPGGRRPPGPR